MNPSDEQIVKALVGLEIRLAHRLDVTSVDLWRRSTATVRRVVFVAEFAQGRDMRSHAAAACSTVRRSGISPTRTNGSVAFLRHHERRTAAAGARRFQPKSRCQWQFPESARHLRDLFSGLDQCDVDFVLIDGRGTRTVRQCLTKTTCIDLDECTVPRPNVPPCAIVLLPPLAVPIGAVSNHWKRRRVHTAAGAVEASARTQSACDFLRERKCFVGPRGRQSVIPINESAALRVQ